MKTSLFRLLARRLLVAAAATGAATVLLRRIGKASGRIEASNPASRATVSPEVDARELPDDVVDGLLRELDGMT